MVVYAERFIVARSADEGGLQSLIRAMDFKFDIQALLAPLCDLSEQ
jgi:hypothetical protein